MIFKLVAGVFSIGKRRKRFSERKVDVVAGVVRTRGRFLL